MTENKLTSLSTLGKSGLIKHLATKLPATLSSTVKGIGDDAAVITSKNHTLITTETFIEHIHFDLGYVPLKHLGFKMVTAVANDIYAMNGTPRHLLVAISLSNRFSVEAVDDLYEGIRLACERYEIDLIGGHTTSSTAGLQITVTLTGEADENETVYRDGARENDLICVSGDLGAAYMGLQLLEREKSVYNAENQPILEGYEYILERQLKPEARREIKDWFKANNLKPTAMLNLSSGLAAGVITLCEASHCGAEIYEEKLPIDVQTAEMAEEMNLNPTVCALSGGEDYELLFTLPLALYDTVKSAEHIAVIGHISRGDTLPELVTRDGTHITLKAQGRGEQ